MLLPHCSAVQRSIQRFSRILFYLNLTTILRYRVNLTLVKTTLRHHPYLPNNLFMVRTLLLMVNIITFYLLNYRQAIVIIYKCFVGLMNQFDTANCIVKITEKKKYIIRLLAAFHDLGFKS